MIGAEAEWVAGHVATAATFVGRRQEVAEARRILAVARLLTLTGPGGVGKSSLAGRVIEKTEGSYPDGARIVPLAELRDPVLVPCAVADAFGLPRQEGRRPVDTLVQHLGSRRALLILDGCEHLQPACRALAGTLLAATDELRVLATSRHRLGLPGEHLLEVAPLPTSDPDALDHDPAAGLSPALTLFAERAAALVPGFRITERNQDDVLRLCHMLDGLPLAIELAAGRLRAFSVTQIAERLADDRSHLLSTAAGDSACTGAGAHHSSLRATVEWSYALCTAREQQVWTRLSVFTGRFDLAAASAVCPPDGPPDGPGAVDVAEAVAGLVDKSVLVREGGAADGTARYRLLGALRDFGLERLRQSAGEADARRRHRDHWLAVGERAEGRWFGPGQAQLIAATAAGLADIRAALEHCRADPGSARLGLQLVGSLWWFWLAAGAWREGRHWRDELARAVGHETDAGTKALWLAEQEGLVERRTAAVLSALDTGAFFPLASGDERAPDEASDQAASGGVTSPDGSSGDATSSSSLAPPLEVTALGMSGLGAPARGTPPPGPTMPEGLPTDSLPLLSSPALPPVAARAMPVNSALLTYTLLCRLELAGGHLLSGRSEDALDLCREALRACRDHGEEWVGCRALFLLALVEAASGARTGAAGHAREAVRTGWEFPGRAPAAGALRLLAVLCAEQAEAVGSSSVARRAVLLLGVAERLCRDSARAAAHLPYAPEGERLPGTERRIRALLLPREFDLGFARGAGLTPEQALSLALDDSEDSEDELGVAGGAADTASTAAPREELPVDPQYAQGGPGPVVTDLEMLLSPREAQVAELVAQGRTNQQVADILVISRRTAECHVAHILDKLGMDNRRQITRWVTLAKG